MLIFNVLYALGGIKCKHHPMLPQEESASPARKALLLKEKNYPLRDKINAERLALPWVKVEKNYVF